MPPGPPGHLPRAIVPVPMALTQYLQRSRQLGRGHSSVSRACDPSVPPQLHACPHWGPPKLSLCPLSASVPVVTSRAWIRPPHLLSPTECSSNSAGGAAGRAQLSPTPRDPPSPPGDSQRHKLLCTEGTVGLGEEDLGAGRKFGVAGGRFWSREED